MENGIRMEEEQDEFEVQRMPGKHKKRVQKGDSTGNLRLT